MYNKRVMNNARELSQQELVELERALNKWYPAITQTYNTPLIDMMANPYKKGLIHAVVATLFIFVLLFLNYKFDFIEELQFANKNKNVKKILVVVLVVVFFIVFGQTAYSQYKHNENLKLMMTLTKPGATKYDYESSNVIQSKLMRNAYRGGSSDSGIGSGIAGGVLGYGLGSSRRRRGGFGRRRR